jgi:DNA-binding MarR family transcriptional regulator
MKGGTDMRGMSEKKMKKIADGRKKLSLRDSVPETPSAPPLPLTLRGVVLFTRYIRRNLTLDFPMNQAAVLVAVYAQGDAGATYADIGGFLGGMSLSSVSKNVGRLSRYMAPKTGREAGHGLLRSEPDIANRKRSRVFLTDRGRELVHVLDACLTGEFTMQTDLPREIPDEAFTPDTEKGEIR